MKKLLLLLLPVILSCSGGDSDGIILGPGEGTSGIGGSTARFAIRNGYMYVSTNSKLKVLDLKDATHPNLVNTVTTFGNLETAVAYENLLFLGANDGVYIYDLIDPVHPDYITKFTHQTGCDPVIANGNVAYLTIRDGQTCTFRNVNQLITIDISDLTNPVGLDTISMIRPRGLSIFNGSLYVGEGAFGLKKFDITTPYEPKLDTFYADIPANDMIALTSEMIVTAGSGVSQFNLVGDTLNQISTIK